MNARNSSASPAAGLEDAKKIADGVAGIFSALEALGVDDPEVRSLCQVGAALTHNLSNELETAIDGKTPRHLRAVPVVGSFNACDSMEGEG